MKAWQHIINTAMLGTDKPMPARNDLPADIAEIDALIDAIDELDKEDRFLHKAAVISNYRQSGFVPLPKPEITLAVADTETLPYCSAQAAAVLNGVLEEDNDWLLKYWLEHCAAKAQLLKPEMLPAVLDKARTVTGLQPLVIACSGKRGEWLSRFNPDWRYFNSIPEDELWQNGKPEDRLKAIKAIRQNDPAKALRLVRETWEQENAAAKTELLKALAINNSAGDLPWLESLSVEKSQKVKDEAMNLLKLIPGSSIIQKYEEVLRQSVTLSKEKGLLGLMSKTAIRQKLPDTIDESIFKSGIEKFTGSKSSISDEGYIIYQLISHVPPSFWQQQFEASAAEVVDYFDKYAKTLAPALGLAVVRFNADDWIPYFMDQPQFYPKFLNKLSSKDQEKYLLRFFVQDSSNIIQHALKSNHEWGPAFTAAAVQFMSANPYQYNRNFFKEHIGLIHTNILPQHDGMAITEGNWDKTRQYLIGLLNLKQQIRQVFN